MHSRLCRYFKNVCTSAFILQGGVAQPGIGVLQLGIGDALVLGKLRQVVDTRADGDLRIRNGRIKMFPFQQEAVTLRITDDGFGGKQAEHIAGSLLNQPEVYGLIYELLSQFGRNASLSAIVGGGYTKPVAISLVSIFQILACRAGCFFHMITFINAGVDFKAEFASGGLHELPHSGGSCRTAGKGVQVAFYDGKIFEVIGHTVFFQYRFDDGKETVGTFDGEHGGGVHIGERHLFAVHALAVVVTRQINFLSGKADFIRYGRGGDAIGNFGFNGLLFRVQRTMSQQERECGACTQGD